MSKYIRLVLLSVFILTVVFSFLLSSAARAVESAGSKTFISRGCGSCHRTARPAGPVTRSSELAKKGPDLWYAGSKFREGFLASWLVNPTPIRPLAYNSLEEKNPADHPRLDVKTAASVASYLMDLKAADLMSSVEIRPGVNVRGRILFIKKFACYGCHLVNVRGNKAGGLSGPSLEGTVRRLNPQWIYSLLINQGAFTPVSRMPIYEGLAREAEIKALASYVAGLK